MKHDSQSPIPRNDLLVISGDVARLNLIQLAAREWKA